MRISFDQVSSKERLEHMRQKNYQNCKKSNSYHEIAVVNKAPASKVLAFFARQL